MKKLFLILLIFLTGCATMNGKKGGKLPTNPIMELEIDLVFLDELAAMTKLNQIILERMPVSLEDEWPELLNHYTQKTCRTEMDAKKAYDRCLNQLLKEDFTFFRIYNPLVYTAHLTRQCGLFEALTMGTRATIFVEAAAALGRHYEHAKLVLGRIPFGCKCAYYSRNYQSVSPSSPFCQHKKQGCAFFNKPTEQMLYRYLFAKGSFKSWIDLQITPACFRVVEGEHLGTFKEVFYTLLPQGKQDEIRKIDEQLSISRADLEEIKAQLKNKKLTKEEKEVLNRRKSELEQLVCDIEAIQRRLYKEAINTLEPTPEKIRKAKKLLEITQFIDRTFGCIATAMTFLTPKIIDDIAVWGYLRPQDISQALSSLVIMGAIVGPNAHALSQERFKLLGKRVITLPVNYFKIWGHVIAQKRQVARYKGYLQAMVRMEER